MQVRAVDLQPGSRFRDPDNPETIYTAWEVRRLDWRHIVDIEIATDVWRWFDQDRRIDVVTLPSTGGSK